MKKLGFAAFLLFAFFVSSAQETFTVSGEVRDAENGESLIGATVRIGGTTTGTTANAYGYYSLSLPKGSYELIIG